MNSHPNLRRPADDLLVLLSDRLNAKITELTEPYTDILTRAAQIVPSIKERITGTWVDLLHAQDVADEVNRGMASTFASALAHHYFKTYTPVDPHYQLKILHMKEIKNLGVNFFGNVNPKIPGLSIPLYEFRNRHCHFAPHEPEDVQRAFRKAAQLLEALGDDQGKVQALALMDHYTPIFGLESSTDYTEPQLSYEVQLALAKEKHAAEPEAGQLKEPLHLTEQHSQQNQTNHLKATDSGTIEQFHEGAQISEQVYHPWEVEALGTPEVFESVRSARNYTKIRNAIKEIVEFEGPISLERLQRLVAYSFGLAKTSAKVRRQIAHQVTKVDDIFMDEFKFIWPTPDDFENFSSYRTDPSGYQRAIKDISPYELANIYSIIEGHKTTQEERDRAVLQILDRKRLTSATQAQLALAQQVLANSKEEELS